MKKFLFTLSFIFIFVSNSAVAEETKYGLGVGLNHGVTVFFPIKFDNWLIEPTLHYYSSEQSTGGYYSQKAKTERIEIGSGFFRLNSIAESANIYTGIRLGYIKYKQDINDGYSLYTRKGEGYFLAPAIGLQHLFNQNLSISLDASLYYQNTDSESGPYGSSSTNETGISTRSEIIVRYVY